MCSRNNQALVLFVTLIGIVVLLAQSVTAQNGGITGVQSYNAEEKKDQTFKVTARFHVEKGTNKGFLIVKAQIPIDSFIYGLAQKGPVPPSKFVITKSKMFRTAGTFKSEHPPKIIEKDPVFQARLEKHYGVTQFYVPMEFVPSGDHKQMNPIVQFDGQLCSDKGFCKQIRKMKITAQFAGYFDRQAAKPSPPKTPKRR